MLTVSDYVASHKLVIATPIPIQIVDVEKEWIMF